MRAGLAFFARNALGDIRSLDHDFARRRAQRRTEFALHARQRSVRDRADERRLAQHAGVGRGEERPALPDNGVGAMSRQAEGDAFAPRQHSRDPARRKGLQRVHQINAQGGQTAQPDARGCERARYRPDSCADRLDIRKGMCFVPRQQYPRAIEIGPRNDEHRLDVARQRADGTLGRGLPAPARTQVRDDECDAGSHRRS